MSRCLSDKALTQAQAGLGSPAEQAHLESCPNCAWRLRALARDLAVIGRVLATTREPLTRTVPTARRWLPAALGASALAFAALLWVEVAVWRAMTVVPPPLLTEEASAMLTEVSAALFSVRGYATATAEAEELLLTGESEEDEEDGESECDGPDWLATPGCSPGTHPPAGVPESGWGEE
ncbi:MAG: hypothetical protein HYY95_16315 [Candidatus Rokubacteria bacterium]|nr:hypothetical protein [Candidatus Rokubacteria bacterium]MBI3107103.1 hypothetical protein [Candidatus Rokubacteria bacterium]